MVWSHVYTMCTQPGFVPMNYRYKIELLPTQFHKALNVKEPPVAIEMRSELASPEQIEDEENSKK